MATITVKRPAPAPPGASWFSHPLTRQIAKAVGVTPRTKKFVLRDEYGLVYDGSCSEHLLAAISRTDKTDLPDDVHNVAYAVYKCLTTARMNVALAQRVQRYTPYQLCGLVAKVTNANTTINIGELADFWINENAALL